MFLCVYDCSFNYINGITQSHPRNKVWKDILVKFYKTIAIPSLYMETHPKKLKKKRIQTAEIKMLQRSQVARGEIEKMK